MKVFERTVSILLCFCVFVIFCGCFANNNVASCDLIRLHIRADSNDAADQAVKLKVRDAIVEYLGEELRSARTAAEAKEVLSARRSTLASIADGVLKDNGFWYGAKAELRREFFPTRAYGDTVVPSGEYDALIVELGSGKGDNWWCVVYPPLCFVKATPGDGVKYKSKIKELWDRYCG